MVSNLIKFRSNRRLLSKLKLPEHIYLTREINLKLTDTVLILRATIHLLNMMGHTSGENMGKFIFVLTEGWIIL